RSSSSEKNAALPTESSLFCTIAIQDDASSAAASAPQPSDTTRSSLAVRTANSDVNASGNTGNTGSKDSEDEEAQLSGNTDDGPQSKKARQESVRTSGRTRQKAVVEEPGVKKGLGLLDPNCINRYLPPDLGLDSVSQPSFEHNVKSFKNSLLAYWTSASRRKSQGSVPASSRQPSKPSKHLSQRMSVSAAGPGVPMPASLVTVPSCFADPKLVQRWLASLPATLTLTELAARLLGDSVLGNATLGIPDALHGRWPSNLAHTLVRILQACEVLRLDVRSAAIASRQHQVDQLDHAAESFHFSLSLAEVMFDQCAAALKSNVSAGASAAGDSKAPGAGNALLDASIPGIFARLFGVIQSASGLLYADKPDLYARVLWLKARYGRLTGAHRQVRECLVACRAVLDERHASHAADGQPNAHETRVAMDEMTGLTVPVPNGGSVTLITSDVVQQLIYEDAANSYMADTQTLLAECQYEQVAQKLVPVLLTATSADSGTELSPIAEAARRLLLQGSAPQSFLHYLESLYEALKHLERPNELLRLQPLLLNEYVSAVLDDDESADSLFPKILECIRTLSADLQRNAVRVESYASSAQDAASLSETESRDLDAVLLSVKPIAQLLVHVAWQLMVAVSDGASIFGQGKHVIEARKSLGVHVSWSWILFLSQVQLRNAIDLHSLSLVQTDGMGTFTSGVVQSKTPDPNASDASAVLRQATGTAAVKAKSQADASSNTDADASDGDNNASDDDDDDDDDDDNESDSTSFSKAADPKSRMVMAMGWIHEQLGEVFLCGADNAAYLRYMMSILSTLEYRKQHVHVNQCYACLYGLIIKLDRETIYEHECPPLPFEKDAATEVFELFSPYILEKLRVRSYRSITYDIRDCFDKISEVLGDPASQNAQAGHNRALIATFLDSSIDPSLVNPSVRHALGTFDLTITDILPSVFHMLHYIAGAIIWTQYNARLANSSRSQEAVDELKEATDMLLKHLSVAPSDVNGWILLGQCYFALSTELLHWSAFKIIEERQTIAQYQRRAFNCFLRAAKLLQTGRDARSATSDSQMSLWRCFGNLCYAICSKPMSGEALSPSLYQIQQLWCTRFADRSRQGSLLDGGSPAELLRQQCRHVLGLSLFCFRKGLSLDRSSFHLNYSIACVWRKLGNVDQTTSRLVRAIQCATVDASTKDKDNDKILESSIKLVDHLATAYHGSKLTATAVLETLARLPSIPPLVDSAGVPVKDWPQVTSEKDPSGVYHILLGLIAQLKIMDRKKWQHKPIYRHAWIHFRVFGDAVAAKTELLALYQLRSNMKSLKSIWKTEFERAGKHFVYVHKYTLFLVQLATMTADTVLLRQLHRRIVKSDDVCLEKDALITQVRQGFLQIVAREPVANSEASRRMCAIVESVYALPSIEAAEQMIMQDAGSESENALARMLFAIDLRRDKMPSDQMDQLSGFVVASYSSLCMNALLSMSATNAAAAGCITASSSGIVASGFGSGNTAIAPAKTTAVLLRASRLSTSTSGGLAACLKRQ
ncbi:hypothetical protein BC831DRAFT_494874, partial [Entophlyctis helioformis]